LRDNPAGYLTSPREGGMAAIRRQDTIPEGKKKAYDEIDGAACVKCGAVKEERQ
jgi:hypothetical protein